MTDDEDNRSAAMPHVSQFVYGMMGVTLVMALGLPLLFGGAQGLASELDHPLDNRLAGGYT